MTTVQARIIHLNNELTVKSIFKDGNEKLSRERSKRPLAVIDLKAPVGVLCIPMTTQQHFTFLLIQCL